MEDDILQKQDADLAEMGIDINNEVLPEVEKDLFVENEQKNEDAISPLPEAVLPTEEKFGDENTNKAEFFAVNEEKSENARAASPPLESENKYVSLEPEPIRKWREETKIRIEKAENKAAEDLQALKENAKKELEAWKAERDTLVNEKLKHLNELNAKYMEKAELAEDSKNLRDEKTIWQDAIKSCKIGKKQQLCKKDTSRMKQLLTNMYSE